eukprot:TRINITY_DN5092_c0_g1_i1.p1 TRINITY_DN5092_c0_g1~~TRINITY_DN5092_c0_g1_i1.p1  ORF type:complete len:590 (+),score=105.97 TRINITY_DN5092_c0_g1_i1:262-2031(+)
MSAKEPAEIRDVDLRIKGTSRMAVRGVRRLRSLENLVSTGDGAPSADSLEETPQKRPRKVAAADDEEELTKWVLAAPEMAAKCFSAGPASICQRLAKQSEQKLKAALKSFSQRRAKGEDIETLEWLEAFVVAVLARQFGIHARMKWEGPVSPTTAPSAKEMSPPRQIPAPLMRAPSWGLGSRGAPKQTLRISAGRAAAAAGIHPYADVGELFLELLYQDLPEMLLRDCALVGVEVVSAMDERTRLMAKSGESAALEKALQAGAGATDLTAIRAARQAVSSCLEAAQRSERLSADEAEELRNALEFEINCEFGAKHEDSAVEVYEKRVGQKVYGTQHRIKAPMFCGGPAEALALLPAMGSATRASVEAAAAATAARVAATDAPADTSENATSATDVVDVEDLCGSSCNDATNVASGGCNGNGVPIETAEEPRPYFFLTGFTDGIVDLPREGSAIATSDATNSCMETLVVEVKHRMGRIQDNPNIYDVVQLCSYCRVLGCARGDLVQCLRNGRSANGQNGDGGELHITRIDFSEGTPHRIGWDKHVLPGLYEVARAVYAAREDDDTRHRLLAASPEERKAIVGELCPHMAS